MQHYFKVEFRAVVYDEEGNIWEETSTHMIQSKHKDEIVSVFEDFISDLDYE